jgi:hypothetical protein
MSCNEETNCSRAKVKQMQRKEAGEDGAVFYGSMAGSPGMMDHMKRNALMRSNSLGHGGGYNLPADIKYGLRMGFPNGPLTPASSPSSKTVISRLTIETLSIGPWHRVACSSMDLVCYFSPMEGRFTYYINNSSSGFKIEYPVTCIRRIKMEHMVRRMSSESGSSTPVSGRDETKHRARIMIELTNAPLFYSEQRVAGGWQLCHDFTQGLVASTILVHTLVGPYEALQQQMTELTAMSPELASRLWVDDQPQYLAFDEDEHTAGSAGDRSRRHSSAASTMAPPPRPASAIPAQFARQHLTPGASHLFNVGGPRVRQSFQAHRRTRSRSLPTAVNVSDLALATSQHLGGNVVPGMKYGNDAGQYMNMGNDMLYNPQTPLRIDTSVADSTMDYYRQFTPGSNISSSMTPVDYASSPASQVPLPSALPFYEGGEFQSVTPSYAHSGMYSTENMDASAMYSEEVNQPAMMNLDYHPDSYNYSTDSSTMQEAQYTAVGDQQWAPQVTVSQMDVDRKNMEPMMIKGQDAHDIKMEN